MRTIVCGDLIVELEKDTNWYSVGKKEGRWCLNISNNICTRTIHFHTQHSLKLFIDCIQTLVTVDFVSKY